MSVVDMTHLIVFFFFGVAVATRKRLEASRG
jgi:hypothetical protein